MRLAAWFLIIGIQGHGYEPSIYDVANDQACAREAHGLLNVYRRGRDYVTWCGQVENYAEARRMARTTLWPQFKHLYPAAGTGEYRPTQEPAMTLDERKRLMHAESEVVSLRVLTQRLQREIDDLKNKVAALQVGLRVLRTPPDR